MRFLLSVLMVTSAVQAPAVAQTAPAKPAAQPAAQAVQPIPRAVFLQNMNNDFAKMDSNKDGQLAKAEIEASLRATAMQQIMARNRAVFVELDKDKSGQLSASEFAAFHAEPAAPNAAPMLKGFDANKDGAITVVEFRAGTVANFDRLDTDKDGIVTAAEMKAGGIIKK